MTPLILRDFHQSHGAQFASVNGQEAPDHYGNVLVEHAALRDTVGVIDLSFRGRLCLTGADRQRFLHGQVTNEVNGLKVGDGCYAALVTAKGKMISDLNICRLEDELLLDFEPGLTQKIADRLEKYVIADDVQITDATRLYGLLTIQGPRADEVLRQAQLGGEIPSKPMASTALSHEDLGDFLLVNLRRVGRAGFDLFAPVASLRLAVEKLVAVARRLGGGLCGWKALEIARIEAGIPRFGIDMNETNLPMEAGLEASAVSYSKGCYIGQEVIARIRTYGQVAKSLRGLRLAEDSPILPNHGDRLLAGDKEVGYVTSAVESPTLEAKIALGYVRRETNSIGTELEIRTGMGTTKAKIVELPFRNEG
ncbi:MAG: aminomethyl transferase family protein [Verrucomicrobia bacterium]|nr:aminomethyl transferase family protein [Verrucomicrobiota bacterium]